MSVPREKRHVRASLVDKSPNDMRISCSSGGLRSPGRIPHAEEGPKAADDLMHHKHEEN